EVELPVEEPLFLRDLDAALEPLRVLDELCDVRGASDTEHHLDRVELLPDLGTADGKLSLPRALALLRVLHDLEGGAEDLLDRLEPLVERRRCDVILRENGPEPQRAPSIHHQAQALVGGVRIRQGLLDLSARDLAALAGLRAPDGDRATGLLLRGADTAQRQAPQLLDPLRELRQLRDLRLRELASPALRVIAQLLRLVGCEILDLRIRGGGQPPLPRQQEVEDLALDAGALPVGVRLIVDGGHRQVLRGGLDDGL